MTLIKLLPRLLPCFRSGDHALDCDDAVGADANAIDAAFDEELGELRVVTWCLAAKPILSTAFRVNGLGDHRLAAPKDCGGTWQLSWTWG